MYCLLFPVAVLLKFLWRSLQANLMFVLLTRSGLLFLFENNTKNMHVLTDV